MDAFSDVYLPISQRCGDLLYALTRGCRPETVIEFGTSFGISTIYLAAAVADNGTGRIFSTELSAHKIAAAQQNLIRSGTDGVVPSAGWGRRRHLPYFCDISGSG